MGKSIICLGRGSLGKAFDNSGVQCLDKNDVNINDICNLTDVIGDILPKYLINCTGIVGTGKCENDPEIAYQVNVGGLSNILCVCKKFNIKLIHFSTVYAGRYNVYTRSKQMAESIIMDSKQDTYVIQLPWLFGENTDNFILAAVKGKKVLIYGGEHGYLAYERDVVQYTVDNINLNGKDVVANEGQLTREELLEFIGISDYKMSERDILMPLYASEPTKVLRNWKIAIKEMIDGIRTV